MTGKERIKRLSSPLLVLRDYLDIPIQYLLGWTHIWSSWGGWENSTISHTLGMEELSVLYRQVHQGIPFSEIKDLKISFDHPLGEFSSDLCDIFQPWHALRSIRWTKKIEKQFPGGKQLVYDFLKSKGIDKP